VPFLTDTGHILKNFCLHLEHLFSQISPKEVCCYNLQAGKVAIIESFCQHQGIPFSAKNSLRIRARKAITLCRTMQNCAATLTPISNLASQCPQDLPKKIDLLVSVWQINSLRAVIPICQKLRAQGLSVAFLVHANDAAIPTLLREYKFCYRFLNQFISTKSSVKALGQIRSFLDGVTTEQFAISLIESIQLPAWAISEKLTSYIITLINNGALLNCSVVHGTITAINELQPAGFIFITQRILHNAILRSLTVSIKKIFIQQGIIPFIPAYSDPMDVDLAIVGSGLEFDYLRRCGVSPEHSAAIGYPWYDFFPELAPKICRQKLCDDFLLTKNKKIVLFTSQYATHVFPEWARRQQLQAFLQTANHLPEVNFLIKLHPRQENFPKALGKVPANVKIIKTYDTFSLIKGSDLMVTYWSTTALEGILLETPVIHFNTTGLPDYFDLSKEMLLETARNSNELRSFILSFLEKNEEIKQRFQVQRVRFMKKKKIVLDGNAASRASQQLVDLLR
jgi:hypothetical protein